MVHVNSFISEEVLVAGVVSVMGACVMLEGVGGKKNEEVAPTNTDT